MKKYTAQSVIAILLVLLSNAIIAQSIKISKIKDSSLTRLINNVQSFHQYSVKDLTITVMEIANPSGSANMPEGHEVTTNLYLGVSESDTYPEQSLFCIKNLYAVSNIEQDQTIPGEAVITFNYVDISNKIKPIKRKVKLKLGLHTATIIK